jgi:hypothetical protein
MSSADMIKMAIVNVSFLPAHRGGDAAARLVA